MPQDDIPSQPTASAAQPPVQTPELISAQIPKICTLLESTKCDYTATRLYLQEQVPYRGIEVLTEFFEEWNKACNAHPEGKNSLDGKLDEKPLVETKRVMLDLLTSLTRYLVKIWKLLREERESQENVIFTSEDSDSDSEMPAMPELERPGLECLVIYGIERVLNLERLARSALRQPLKESVSAENILKAVDKDEDMKRAKDLVFACREPS